MLALKKKDARFKKPLGFTYLLVWFAFIVIFVPNGFLIRSIGYAAWLFFNILTVVLFVQIVDNRQKLIWIYRTYLMTFALLGLFGIFQFIAPFLGLGGPFVEQWWIPEVVARANGFSFEPSYYATYLLMGWIITAFHMYNDKSTTVEKRALLPYLPHIHYIITLAIILSSSRMGLFMIGVWFLQYPARLMLSFYKLRIKTTLAKMNLWLLGIGTALLGVVVTIKFEVILLLLAGTGLFGTPTHSSVSRFDSMIEVLELFAESPVIGYSLGGISTALAEHRGVHVTDLAQLKEHEGINVTAEILAASGIIGFFPFFLYITSLFYQPIKRLKKLTDETTKKILTALLLAFLFELLILQFNQNILRPYFWLHVAVLSGAYRVAKSDRQETRSHHLKRVTENA